MYNCHCICILFISVGLNNMSQMKLNSKEGIERSCHQTSENENLREFLM